MSENTKSNFITKDLCLATFLLSMGKNFTLVQESDNRFTFHFDKNKEIQGLIDQYFKRTALVEPQNFYMAMRQIKSRIYNFHN